MNKYTICNKCYCTQDKIEYPFELTQCGHIFCNNCLKEVRNGCPQCKSKGMKTVLLKEPLISEVSKLFIPLNDILISVKSSIIFQTEQISITLQCFYQFNDKYEMLKYRYLNAIRNKKKITCEYYNLKKHMENVAKKVMFMKMQSTNSRAVDLTSYFTRQGNLNPNISSKNVRNKTCNINISRLKLFDS